MDDVCRMIWETNVTKIIVCVAGANTSNENNRTVFVDNHTGTSDAISNISVTEPSMMTPSTSIFDLAPSLALLMEDNLSSYSETPSIMIAPSIMAAPSTEDYSPSVYNDSVHIVESPSVINIPSPAVTLSTEQQTDGTSPGPITSLISNVSKRNASMPSFAEAEEDNTVLTAILVPICIMFLFATLAALYVKKRGHKGVHPCHVGKQKRTDTRPRDYILESIHVVPNV